MQRINPVLHLGRVMTSLRMDLVRFLSASLRARTALAAENLFLRKKLALYRERQVSERIPLTPRSFLKYQMSIDISVVSFGSLTYGDNETHWIASWP